VFLSEDGKNETSVTTAVIEKKEEKKSPDKTEDKVHEKHELHPEGVSGNTRTIRIIAIAVAMFFSLLLSMAVGAGLALYDSNRTMAELTAIITGHEVAAATNAESAVEEVSESNGDVSPDADDEEAEWTEEADEEEDYGHTINSDTEGLEGISKAGGEDEIKTPDDSEGPDALKDPLEDYPLPFTTVDESYFTDALFIGDSRLQGFGFWSGLPATYYCATGFALYKYDTAQVVQTENGKVPIFEAMPYDAFTKIYIKVGLNELGYGTEENFEKYYAELIAKLREYEPRAIIYVHAILPVTAAKSQSDKAHNNPNIEARNASLKKFAESQKAYFLDAGPALADLEGNLPAEMTGDGIHLKQEYMKLWRDYLCEHAVDVTAVQ
jgi:hypothetical protein